MLFLTEQVKHLNFYQSFDLLSVTNSPCNSLKYLQNFFCLVLSWDLTSVSDSSSASLPPPEPEVKVLIRREFCLTRDLTSSKLLVKGSALLLLSGTGILNFCLS